MDDRQRLEAILDIVRKYLPPDGIPIKEAMSQIIYLVDLMPPKQKPVAWDGECVLGHCGSPAGCEDSGCCRSDSAPPQREWVGLTNEDIKEIIGNWGDAPIKGYTRKLFDQIEAKLREKNT